MKIYLIKAKNRDMYLRLTESGGYEFTSIGKASITTDSKVVAEMLEHLRHDEVVRPNFFAIFEPSGQIEFEVVYFEEFDIIVLAKRLQVALRPGIWHSPSDPIFLSTPHDKPNPLFDE